MTDNQNNDLCLSLEVFDGLDESSYELILVANSREWIPLDLSALL
jgi:hypothetical protein